MNRTNSFGDWRSGPRAVRRCSRRICPLRWTAFTVRTLVSYRRHEANRTRPRREGNSSAITLTPYWEEEMDRSTYGANEITMDQQGNTVTEITPLSTPVAGMPYQGSRVPPSRAVNQG